MVITYFRQESKKFHFKYYKKILKDNNLSNITFHELRRPFATLLLINNFSLKTISCLLDHALTIVTYDVYFDKSQVVIDYTNELDDYIKKVVHIDAPFNDLIGYEFDCKEIYTNYLKSLKIKLVIPC